MKLPEEEISYIGIFRALQLGDLLCSIPAVRALRQTYPHAKIALIGLPTMSTLADRFPNYFDEFIIFPGYLGLPEQGYDPELFEQFLTDMQSRKFDLIVQMQGNGSIVNQLLKSFKSRYLAGFCERDGEESDLFLKYPDYGHEVTRHLALMAHLGIDIRTGGRLEFPLIEHDFDIFSKSILKPLVSPYICLHPGSRGSWRQWPPLYFAATADLCIKKGFQVVITGTRSELALAEQVAAAMLYEPLILAGKTSLGEVAALLSRSQGLISNCTGVSHIAAALEVRSVVISMDGEPKRWGPINTELHHTIDWTKSADYDLVADAVRSLFLDKKL